MHVSDRPSAMRLFRCMPLGKSLGLRRQLSISNANHSMRKSSRYRPRGSGFSRSHVMSPGCGVRAYARSLRQHDLPLLCWEEPACPAMASEALSSPAASSSSVHWRSCVPHVLQSIKDHSGSPTTVSFLLMIPRFRATVRRRSAMKRRAAGGQIGSPVPARFKIQSHIHDAIASQNFGSTKSRTDAAFPFVYCYQVRYGIWQ